MMKLLVINPGSTSTKIGVFEDDTAVLVETLRHSAAEVGVFAKIVDQFEFRKAAIIDVLERDAVDPSSLDGVVGRGGLLRPLPSGTYAVNAAMIAEVMTPSRDEHASNLGCLIAGAIAEELDIPAFIVDPVCVDELQPLARLSGIPEIERASIFHALNQKAVARRFARTRSRLYQELNLIVVHMGSGISVGVHAEGRVIDVNNALNGDGPYSPERSGGLPVGELVRLCFSGRFTEAELLRRIAGGGGVMAYLGTNNMTEVQTRAREGNETARMIFEGFAYQTAKEIGAAATVLNGAVDQIILTGGVAYCQDLTALIISRVSFIAPVTIYPGEDELLALAEGALRVLNGEEAALQY